MQKRIGFVLVVGLAVAALAWWRWNVVAEQRAQAIRGSGIIEVTQVDVAFEVPGTITERFAEEGALLDKGEPIARLDEREYRLQVERAHAAKAAAAARYQMLVKGAREQDVDQALAATEAAEADFTLVQREFQRIKSLYDDRVVSQAEFDRVANALTAATKVRDRARAQLSMLKEGFRTEEIEQARAMLREAEKAVEIAELQLARCQLFAPIAGRVLSKNREAGETVPPGASIVTLGDLTRPWLNVYISERDLGHVALGMPAEVSIDSFPDRRFPGTVTFIADKSEFTPKNIQTQDERVKLVYRVKIALDNPDQILKPGMPADAVIPLNHNTPPV